MSESCPTCGSDKREVRGAYQPRVKGTLKPKRDIDGEEFLIPCPDPWHGPAPHGDTTASGGGYDPAADLQAVRNVAEAHDAEWDKDAAAATVDRLAAYIERLEGDVVQAREDGWIAGRYEQRNLDAADRDRYKAALADLCAGDLLSCQDCPASTADRDQHKAEAERWERVARVLAKRCEQYGYAKAPILHTAAVHLAWAEKEADK